MENLKEIEKIRCHPTIIIEKLMTVIIASIAVAIALFSIKISKNTSKLSLSNLRAESPMVIPSYWGVAAHLEIKILSKPSQFTYWFSNVSLGSIISFLITSLNYRSLRNSTIPEILLVKSLGGTDSLRFVI